MVRAGSMAGPALRAAILVALLAAAAALALAATRLSYVAADGADAAAASALFVAVALMILWPALDEDAATRPMARLVALVGCDGSGKSTLSADIYDQLHHERAVRLCYLGLGSGAIGERIKRLPIVGRHAERVLSKKAKQTRTRGEKIPGIVTALVVYGFSLARLRRFRAMMKLRRAGVTIITDRYPQTEIAGFYDGPGLSAANAGGWAVAALARAERRIYDWMASVRPDVVIRLNVDAETAHARKPDHGYELLRQKVEATSRLRFGGARIVDLDSTDPYPVVRAEVSRIVNRTLALPLAA